MWPQSWQASICPPRAAVRQASIAAITLSWPRLTCPAWARRHADPRPEVLRIGRDGEGGLGRGLEQEIVDHRLVGPGQIRDRGRQREHDVAVGHGQQFGLAIREPVPGRRALTLRAVPVATEAMGRAARA